MCGIAGIISHRGGITPRHIQAMTVALKHRGPDDEGYLAIDTAGRSAVPLAGPDSASPGRQLGDHGGHADAWFGHRRLSVIDISPAGHQPMASADGSLWIVYNGEIYNYLELRRELAACGHAFTTGTDTEVVLAAYRAWGIGCLQRFNGMWSFVIYDRDRDRMICARDRFGVKPFYYYSDGDRFVFASEIKALLQAPGVPKAVNTGRIFDYLVLAQEEDEETFFAGIHSLLPSHTLTIDLRTRSVSIQRYYELPCTDRWERHDEAACSGHQGEVRRLITEAVQLRLRSDVPVGSCLSGGLDSSTIVCTVNQLLAGGSAAPVGDRQKVFTAAYPGSPIDEQRWAKLVADQTRTDWRLTYPRADELLADLRDLIRTQETPFGSTSIYAQYRVMKLARESGVTVLLDGQGGDELFTGYTTYYSVFVRELARHAAFGDLASELVALANAPLGIPRLALDLIRQTAARALPPGIKPKLLRYLFPENRYLRRDFWEQNTHRLGKMSDQTGAGLNRMLLAMMTGDNLRKLLKYEDRNSMRFSIESRTPFADDIALIEYVFQVPGSYKIHHGWNKHLLREAMRGMLPGPIADRTDKIGFATPEHAWLLAGGRRFQEYFTRRIDPLMDTGKLRRDWARLLSGQNRSGLTSLWRFVNLGLWMEEFDLSA